MNEAEHLALLAAVIYAGSGEKIHGASNVDRLEPALADAKYIRDKARTLAYGDPLDPSL